MGLASAITTALTGLSAAETQIDVIGNNLANAQTTGFKQSRVEFATQFFQTQSIGSAPTVGSGGSNPRQIGLGVKVAGISTDFTPGTIEPTANPSDLAIEGDGFFILDGGAAGRLYTRNGAFGLNADQQLVNSSGYRLLGYRVDENDTLQTGELSPLTIPLGAASVAQATTRVTLEGTLTPTGDVADTAQVIETLTLGDASIPPPDVSGATSSLAPVPQPLLAPTQASSATVAGGALTAGTQYEYRFAFVDAVGTESVPSAELEAVVGQVTVGGNAIALTNLPIPSGNPPEYTRVNIYRRQVGAAEDTPEGQFRLVGSNLPAGGAFTDNGSVNVASAPTLNTTTLNGSYTYMVTFVRANGEETRPAALPGGAIDVSNGRVHIQNLPPLPDPGENSSPYTHVRLYRNLSNNPNAFYLVETLQPGDSYTDGKSDAEISNLSISGNKTLNMDGPPITASTLLTNVIRRDGNTYERVFEEGVLHLTGNKGGRSLATQELVITDTTTVGDLLAFMEDALGIQPHNANDPNPIPTSENHIPGETGSLSPGASLQDGRIRLVSNNGVANALSLEPSSMTLVKTNGETTSPGLVFNVLQEAEGEGAIADFVAYDSLGAPLNVRITTVLESRTDNGTTYRWFAESPDNDPVSGSEIAVGSGLITFDGDGKLISATNATVAIERRNIASTTPLQFDLDFSKLSGLAAPSATLAVTQQDGFPAGKLDTYTVGEDGLVRGVFSNGATRILGQIPIARFANPQGLEQRSETMFAEGVNSGLPVIAAPGTEGTGTLISGALELSNADIGENLTDLVIAATYYRGNTRVISTAQQLLDELLNIRR